MGGLQDMPLLHLRLLGGFECRSTTGEVITFPTRKVRACLAWLGTNAGHRHGR